MEAIEGSWVNGAEAVVDEDAAEQEWEYELKRKRLFYRKVVFHGFGQAKLRMVVQF